MLVALIMTVCLHADRGQCQDREFIFESRGSLMQCMLGAPPFIADWSQTHPKWTVARWRCADPGSLGRQI